jgi:hypothetical protein
MSLDSVRPYFKARMQALGLKEWKNPFDTSNIPENIIGSQYNVALAPSAQLKFSQQNLDLRVPINLKLFVKAYKQHMVAYDSAIALANDVLVEVLKPSNRLTQTDIKTINMGLMSIDPYAPTNDNIMVVNFVFNVDVALEVCD